MPETKKCPKCRAELPENAPAGICPKCLMQAGLASEPDAGSTPEMKTTPFTSGFVPPAPEELAKHFPQLEILELLGKGGMGAVYKARQPGLDRLVAVKILPPEIGADPAFAERFMREARALAKLSHQSIVPVFDFGQADGQFYFVMEFVDGMNLRQLIETGGLKSEEALAIVPQICEALQFAHNAGIVHRDIKPENILVDKQGRVKIADFGLAKLLGKAPAELKLTGTHQAMGTLHYMAPEQMRGAGAVDHRADIYSLGVVFYELLTGELPMGKFAPPSRKVHVDVRMDEIVLRALEQDPEQRYQHASEVKTDVESVQSGERPVFASVQASGRSAASREALAAHERQALDACERLLTSKRRERIRAALAEDEQLIWADKIGVASTWRYAGRMGLTLIGILTGFFVGSGGLQELARTGWDIGSFANSLAGVLCVLAVGAAALLAIRRRERVFYTLTNRRAIVWDFGRWGAVSAQSYGPTQLASAEYIENRNGSGSLIFEKASSYFSAARGFKDIDDVREVHERIRRVILNQPTTRGPTTK